MSFTSFDFVLFIFPILIVYYLIPSVLWKKCILFIVSILFYLSFEPTSFVYFTAVIFYVYAAGLLLSKFKSKWMIFLLIIPVTAGLCYFKYSNFILDFFHSAFSYENERMNLIAPLGISFFTFKSLGYLIDVYRGKQNPDSSLLNIALYLTFFPQIASGPIQKSTDFLSQINENRKYNASLAQHGTLLVLFGAFEKMVISDRLYVLVNHCFKDLSVLTPSMALIGAVAYAFQIYSDFDSYSNIAIGLAEMFGYRCSKNFDVPYLSKNMKEFWTRWHISLSTWLKEYIYIPLGGNRKGTIRKYANLLIVFAVSGLWHGAAWNYVLWGLLNGVVQIVYDLTVGKVISLINIKNRWLSFSGSILGIMLNFCVVVCLWVFFRFQSLEQILLVFKALFQFDIYSFTFAMEGIKFAEIMVTLLMTVLLIIVDVLRYIGFTMKHFIKIPFLFRMGIYAVMIAVFLIFAVYGPGYDSAKFIYLEF